jgi:LDH2 family malate/lactate/ureidoglycolate dehydrogenase
MKLPDKIPAEQLIEVCETMLKKMDVPGNIARITSDVLVRADLRGIHSHGVSRMSVYVQRIKNGAMSASPDISKIKESGSTELIDGGNGLGQYCAYIGMERCIAKARETGVGVTGIRNNNHIGMASYFSMMALDHDMIGITFNNGSPHVAAWGGSDPLIGTNPISIAIPSGADFPVVLDMASTIVSRGKIILAEKEQKEIPVDWAFDKRGVPTTDPLEALKGTLMPIGGYKGYGLSLCIDILSGLLTGALFGPYVPPMAPGGSEKLNQGVLLAAIQIERFISVQEFKEKMKDLTVKIKSSDRKPGVNEIFLPGEIEFNREKENRERGLSLPGETKSELEKLFESVK